ncbi:aldehyde dehydrogenase family protein [Rheinheimera tangshanensis]|jgi:aldehyde dehydrogenase (NAD+)/succinate-semialdehyde dehydrogenase/glutarate-semialdehyde dehydrogenase|uniref:Aldehyde dehydrogenase n=1 Tax=Rheinheimera tangshanensis TaxID=400153 RepID=A0A5C8LV01_9GAMM|nr:aldehyde dehydrogenase family protein [Rheinheimera tangshanensis]TXK81091.1 aldehyde dehydrogenase [Rheinheimera tangshanensis]GGM57987.1 NAD-dependent succinate-semialdehyde dehydrogenase [Rheinheimera tangshanensis]
MEPVLISTNPLNQEEVGRVTIASADEIARVVANARQAQPAWAALSVAERKNLVERAYTQLDTVHDDLVRLICLEMGKDFRRASYEVSGVIQSAPYLAEEVAQAVAPVSKGHGVELQYRPLGVVGVISPWNYPLAMANNLIIPALVAGNTVVLKPSELTPLVADTFVKLLAEFLPADVINIVHGNEEAGKALVSSDINMVAFTGSVQAGKNIMRNASSRLHRLVMELGGNDPMIVLPDADINTAARFAVASSLENTGQMCTSTERIYVDASIYDQFVAKVVEIAAAYRPGAWNQAGIHIGPMASAEQHQHVVKHLADAAGKGARFVLGQPEYPRPYIQPTVVTGLTEDMLLEREETFGPVVAIAKVDSVDEAIRRANQSIYGLGAVVFGQHGARQVADAMEAGMVSINGSVGSGNAPWVGAKQSGLGYHGGLEGHRQFTQIRVMSR